MDEDNIKLVSGFGRMGSQPLDVHVQPAIQPWYAHVDNGVVDKFLQPATTEVKQTFFGINVHLSIHDWGGNTSLHQQVANLRTLALQMPDSQGAGRLESFVAAFADLVIKLAQSFWALEKDFAEPGGYLPSLPNQRW